MELVIFNNLAIDALLIIATVLTRRKKLRKLRIALAAVIGAAAATGYALLPHGWQVAVRIILAPLLTLIFDKYINFADYLKSLALFALFTFALGGIVTGLGNILGIDLNGYAALGAVALGITVFALGLKYAVNKRASLKKDVKDVKMRFGGREFYVRGMCDSGNALTDTLTGAPVVILSERMEKKMGAAPINLEGYIEVSTVNGESSMPLIKLDNIEVNGKSSEAFAALSRKNFGAYDVILQNTLF